MRLNGQSIWDFSKSQEFSDNGLNALPIESHYDDYATETHTFWNRYNAPQLLLKQYGRILLTCFSFYGIANKLSVATSSLSFSLVFFFFGLHAHFVLHWTTNTLSWDMTFISRIWVNQLYHWLNDDWSLIYLYLVRFDRNSTEFLAFVLSENEFWLCHNSKCTRPAFISHKKSFLWKTQTMVFGWWSSEKLMLSFEQSWSLRS